mmetsp:Transcript_6164/g.18633  ORF Transcript_6164/g.18633 Transcript_6164/m.18633 type:complete len:247 (+) Transcript_6164:387-1127(+)
MATRRRRVLREPRPAAGRRRPGRPRRPRPLGTAGASLPRARLRNRRPSRALGRRPKPRRPRPLRSGEVGQRLGRGLARRAEPLVPAVRRQTRALAGLGRVGPSHRAARDQSTRRDAHAATGRRDSQDDACRRQHLRLDSPRLRRAAARLRRRRGAPRPPHRRRRPQLRRAQTQDHARPQTLPRPFRLRDTRRRRPRRGRHPPLRAALLRPPARPPALGQAALLSAPPRRRAPAALLLTLSRIRYAR